MFEISESFDIAQRCYNDAYGEYVKCDCFEGKTKDEVKIIKAERKALVDVCKEDLFNETYLLLHKVIEYLVLPTNEIFTIQKAAGSSSFTAVIPAAGVDDKCNSLMSFTGSKGIERKTFLYVNSVLNTDASLTRALEILHFNTIFHRDLLDFEKVEDKVVPHKLINELHEVA